MKRPPVGTETRPLVVRVTAGWSLAGHWFVNVRMMTRNEAGARKLGERNVSSYVVCRSEAQARKLAKLLSTAMCDDGPEPAEEEDES